MKVLRNIRCLECGGKRKVFVGMPHEDEPTDIYEWCQSCKGTGTITAQFESDGTLYWPRTIDELLAGRRIE